MNINSKLKEKCDEYYSLPTHNIKLNLFLITNGGDITKNDYNILKTFEKKHNFIRINFINHFEFFLDDEKKLNEKYSIELSQRPFIMVENIIKSFVINIEANEICRLYEHYQNTILNKNIRKLVRSKLNKEITKSILDEPEMFWYKNNGISIIAKYVDIKDISGKTVISLKEPYIVNGGQTTKLLFNLFKKSNKNILENSILLVRIYKTENDEQISDIVLGTNQQNKITLYDLKSSNKTLKKLKMFFEQEGISLLIQRNSEEKVLKRNISSDKLLQIYCSMYRKIPHISKSSKESIIKEYYDDVYSNPHIHNDLLLSFLIYETVINEYNSLKSSVNHIPHSLYAVLYTMFLLSSDIVDNFNYKRF
ncbi:AIPR family protein [Brachyspira hyodysenteriae]|uniref:AIPR family protein n=1 Tax=Brachyspira hyodysenteriae TaxID=159 RepID=UPI0022CE3458|nr:AIPR family protein [Brachyspira hyodysenteriae]MDA0157068.1 AIPR family protein [Brachyspira hyodysenteriae]